MIIAVFSEAPIPGEIPEDSDCSSAPGSDGTAEREGLRRSRELEFIARTEPFNRIKAVTEVVLRRAP